MFFCSSTNVHVLFKSPHFFSRYIFQLYIFYRNTCEDLSIRAKEQAERCQLDKVEALVQQCNELIHGVATSMGLLQRGIEVALAELDKFEGTVYCYV